MPEGIGGRRQELSESAEGRERRRMSAHSSIMGGPRSLHCSFHSSLAFHLRSCMLCSCSSFIFYQRYVFTLPWLLSMLCQFVPSRSLTASSHGTAKWMYLLCLFNRDGFPSPQTQTLLDNQRSFHHAQIPSLQEVVTSKLTPICLFLHSCKGRPNVCVRMSYLLVRWEG